MNTEDFRCDTSVLCASVSLIEASKRQTAHLKSWFYQLLPGNLRAVTLTFLCLKRHIYKVETRGRPSSLASCGICGQTRCLVHSAYLEARAIFIRITSEGSLKRIKSENGHPGSCCPHTCVHTPPRVPVLETLHYQRSRRRAACVAAGVGQGGHCPRMHRGSRHQGAFEARPCPVALETRLSGEHR